MDDASGDATLDRLRELQTRFGSDWIRIIVLDANCGPASARNAGWDVAKGILVAFLDADDAWHPQKIEIQSAVMQQHDKMALSGHRAAQLDPRATIVRTTPSTTFERLGFGQFLMANRFVTPSVMVRRDLPFRFKPGQRHMEDHLLWMQIAASGALVARLVAVLAYTFKSPYGDRGQSAALWRMEKAECTNYLFLSKTGLLSAPVAWLLCAYSMAKFIKRLAVVAARTIFRSQPF